MNDFIKTFTVKERKTTPEIDKLKSIRNEYYNKITELEKEIDKKYYELHEVPDFSNKWVKFEKSNTVYIGLVRDIFRLVDGFKLFFHTLYYERNGFTAISDNRESDSGINFHWDETVIIGEISQEKAINLIYSNLNTILKKYEVTKTE